jgi:hypothetical protein
MSQNGKIPPDRAFLINPNCRVEIGKDKNEEYFNVEDKSAIRKLKVKRRLLLFLRRIC